MTALQACNTGRALATLEGLFENVVCFPAPRRGNLAIFPPPFAVGAGVACEFPYFFPLHTTCNVLLMDPRACGISSTGWTCPALWTRVALAVSVAVSRGMQAAQRAYRSWRYGTCTFPSTSNLQVRHYVAQVT